LFIDLNKRDKKATTIAGDITISLKGIPIYPINLEMKSNGDDNVQKRNKW
jgi:hypothetical protein